MAALAKRRLDEVLPGPTAVAAFVVRVGVALAWLMVAAPHVVGAEPLAAWFVVVLIAVTVVASVCRVVVVTRFVMLRGACEVLASKSWVVGVSSYVTWREYLSPPDQVVAAFAMVVHPLLVVVVIWDVI